MKPSKKRQRERRRYWEHQHRGKVCYPFWRLADSGRQHMEAVHGGNFTTYPCTFGDTPSLVVAVHWHVGSVRAESKEAA